MAHKVHLETAANIVSVTCPATAGFGLNAKPHPSRSGFPQRSHASVRLAAWAWEFTSIDRFIYQDTSSRKADRKRRHHVQHIFLPVPVRPGTRPREITPRVAKPAPSILALGQIRVNLHPRPRMPRAWYVLRPGLLSTTSETILDIGLARRP